MCIRDSYEVGALGVQPGRSTASLDGARTVDYSHARDSMQVGDVPSSHERAFRRGRPPASFWALWAPHGAGCSGRGTAIEDQLQPVSYTHLRAHETVLDLVCRLLLEKKNKKRS